MSYLNNPDRLLVLLRQLVDGFGVTLILFALTLLFSLPLGMLLALARMSRYSLLRKPVQLYILVMRGTPLILQIFTIYFFLPLLLVDR